MSNQMEKPGVTARSVPGGLHRRQFLVLVSASLATPYLLGLPKSLWAAEAEAGVARLVPLTLGYLTGGDVLVADERVVHRLNDPRKSVLETLRAALPEGAAIEARPVRDFSQDLGDFPTDRAKLWVHGMFPPARVRSDSDIEAVDVDVDFFQPGGSQPFTYLAWRFRTLPVVNESAPVGINVPVGGGSAIRLRVTVTRRASGSGSLFDKALDLGRSGAAALNPPQSDRFTAQFNDPGRANELSLKPGIYLVPLGPKANAALPFTVNSDYLVPAERPYLVLSMVPEKGSGS